MITFTVYPKKRTLLSRKHTWGLRIQGGNYETIGHDYNDPDSAIHAAELLTSDDELMILRVLDEDGIEQFDKRRRLR